MHSGWCADKFTGIKTLYKVKNWWRDDIWLGEPDIAVPGLKDIQCWRVHSLLRQSVPETWRQGRTDPSSRCMARAVETLNSLAISSCCSVGRHELLVKGVNQLVGDTVHHGNSSNLSMVLETVPSQILEHGGDTALSRIVIHYIPCCTPLNGFDLVNTLLSRWRPYTTGIFCYWPHKGVVTAGFDFTWAGTKVAMEEVKGSLSFHIGGFQMLVPGQIISEFNSQVFDWLNRVERVAMAGIGEIHWIVTLGHVKYFALFRMKFLEPLSLQLL